MTQIDRDGVLRALFEHHPEPIVLYDVDGLLIDANPAALELSGYPLADLRGTHVSKLGSSKDAERFSVAARRSSKTGPFETTIRTKAGRIVAIECVVFPAVSHGEKKCTLAIARDLSALHSAEHAIDHKQQRFRSLFEFHPDGILMVKADGRVSRVDLALENATGLFNEKLVGKPWTEIVAPESYDTAAAAFAKVMRGEACEIEALFLDRLGERMSMQMNLVPLTEGSQVEGSFVIARNITAQRTAQLAIAKQSQRVRALYLVTATDGTVQEQIDRTLSLGCVIW